jgi:hypothetical protein
MERADKVNEQMKMLGKQPSTEINYLNLGTSERALLDSASQILAALIGSGKHAEMVEEDLIGLALKMALSLANKIESTVKDRDEVSDDDALPK